MKTRMMTTQGLKGGDDVAAGRMREESSLVSPLFRVCPQPGAFEEKRAFHAPRALLN
jgi:hypothetical protein